MAKRKAARRTAVAMRRKVGRSAGRKTASAGRKPAKKTAKTTAAKKAAAKTARRKVASRPAKAKAVVRRTKKTAPRKAVAKKVMARKVVAAKPAAPRRVAAPRLRPERAPVRTAPGLNRERRTIGDDDIVQTPPSSLDFDRSASAARSGRRELRERFDEHTETSPALTGGDVDADWESAYSVGDEAPGGDNPTPDQDLVDDIGRAVGVEYQDNEELKGEAKISKRDRNRWELDPASSDDWDER
jgi:hypothetical protein